MIGRFLCRVWDCRIIRAWVVLWPVLYICLAPSHAFWQSRDSNYNIAISGGAAFAGPCDIVSCAAAYSVTRAMSSSYVGNLFQLSNGSSTLNVGQVSHVADLSGVPAFCKGATCVYSKIYDQSGHSADLVPVTSAIGATNPPSQCTTGNACAAPYWLDANTGLPIIETVFPSEYDVAAASVNGGANPTSVFFYGRNESFPGLFGVGHTPSQSPLVNGTDFLAMPYATNAWATAPTNYINCSGATVACLGIDEETSVEPFDATNKPGAIGATYSTGSNGDIKVLITWDGSSTVKGYVNSSTAVFTDSPPSSVQFNSSALAPGNHVKLGCGGDCTQARVTFREGLVANATLSSTDYTSLASNVSTFYAAHTAAPSCSGMGDLTYQMQPPGFSANFAIYIPQGSDFLSWSLAQTRAGYYGPIADLNNGTTTQTFSGAIAAGSTGCGLDPAAVTFCSPSCTVVKLYNQGSWSAAAIGNVHDSNLDLVFASGQRPTVTFSSLNGMPTMNFTGGQHGCTSNPTHTWGGYFAISAVGRRTGSFTSFQALLDLNVGASTEWEEGFNNTANTMFFYYFNTLPIPTVSASDSHWHQLYVEDLNGTKAPYIDGSAGTTVANSQQTIGNTTPICVGGKSDGSQLLTGDIAEIDILNIQSFASSNGYVSQGSSAFAKMQSLWGTLPN